MARSLLTIVCIHHERPPVFSVTSDTAANLSFQAAPSRPARPDPSQGNDGFGALIDSNTAVNAGNNRATSAAQDQPAPQRRSDDAPATSDSRATRDAAAPDRTAGNTADDRNTAANQPAGDKSDAAANTAAQPGLKSGASKTGPTKSTEKPSSDDASKTASSTDAVALALQAAPAVTTPDAIAVVIPAAVAVTDVPAVAPASGNATAPLAIAAAAIAASASVVSGASPAQATAVGTATAIAADAAVITADATATASVSVKADVQAAAGQAIAAPAKPQGAPTEATPAADVALSEAVAATAPAAPKATPVKVPGTAQANTKTSASSESATGTSDPSAPGAPTGAAPNNIASQTGLAGIQAAGSGASEIVKADASTGTPSAPAAAAPVHEHSATDAGQAVTTSSDQGTQAAGSIQPQLNVPATATPAAALTVTAAATNGAVPLHGLALEIAVSAQSGKSRFEIRLDPADLGRIDVRIDVDRNGQVTSHLTVEKPETLSMLRQDAPQLQRALDDAGFKTGDGGLQFSLRDQSSSGQNNGNETGRNAQRLVISDETTMPAAVAGRTYGRMLGSSSGVDISV